MGESILDTAPPPADLRVRYGEDALRFAEVRLPDKDIPLPSPNALPTVNQRLWPVVMNIHGGFWRSKYNLGHAGHLCAALTDAGFATYNVEYRRVGDPHGGWPGSFEDVRNAYAFLIQHGREFRCDPRQVMVMGHSAGAQLALCLAGHERSLGRVISLAGVLDLQQAYALHLSNDAVVEFLGGTPQQVPEHYREASPMKLKIAARQVVITGASDDVVPPDLSRKYAAQKKSAGEKVELVEIPKAGHFELIDPRTEAFKTVLAHTKELMA
jgi:acetyl esterase/lipase